MLSTYLRLGINTHNEVYAQSICVWRIKKTKYMQYKSTLKHKEDIKINVEILNRVVFFTLGFIIGITLAY